MGAIVSTRPTLDDLVALATELGADAGRAAASWVTNGNTTPATYRRILQGIEDGDPEVFDAYRTPDLSGEYAGDPTPATLADELGLTADEDDDGSLITECCDAYCDAASQAFWDELERVCRVQLEDTGESE